jgi:hypothetical protein
MGHIDEIDGVNEDSRVDGPDQGNVNSLTGCARQGRTAEGQN